MTELITEPVREFIVLLIKQREGTNSSPFVFSEISEVERNKIGIYAREAKYVILYIPEVIIEIFRKQIGPGPAWAERIVEIYLKQHVRLEPDWKIHRITSIGIVQKDSTED